VLCGNEHHAIATRANCSVENPTPEKAHPVKRHFLKVQYKNEIKIKNKLDLERNFKYNCC
jgi:hypothetical protein